MRPTRWAMPPGPHPANATLRSFLPSPPSLGYAAPSPGGFFCLLQSFSRLTSTPARSPLASRWMRSTMGRQHTVQSSTSSASPAEQSTLRWLCSQHQGQVMTVSWSILPVARAGSGVCVRHALCPIPTGAFFLFRGEFIDMIPRPVSEVMTHPAGRGEWKH